MEVALNSQTFTRMDFCLFIDRKAMRYISVGLSKQLLIEFDQSPMPIPDLMLETLFW